MQRILIIDDSESLCQQLKLTLELENFEAAYSCTAAEGLERALSESWGVIMLDVALDAGNNGIDLLIKIKETNPMQQVVMFSGQSTIETAVKATRLGAFDFIEKPVEDERLLLTIRNALERSQLTQFNEQLLGEVQDTLHIIGKNPRITLLINQLVLLGNSDSKVLLLGETGVGKDLFAKGIHYRSKRSAKPFVSLNCAAIPASLVESELFGYVRGAFTGAEGTKPGRFEQAHGGTLFLDEIADLGYAAQAKVLRILQNGEYERLGENKTRQADVRVIAATNKNLRKEMEEGRFREDLFYRLNVVALTIPPLRERRDDIPLLASYFLDQFCKREGKHISHFSPEALDMLLNYDWPGNVRQLRTIAERIAIFESNSFVDFPSTLLALKMEEEEVESNTKQDLTQAVSAFERKYIQLHLLRHKNDLSSCATDLGTTEAELLNKIKHYDIPHKN